MDLFLQLDQMATWLNQFGIWNIIVSLILSIGISILGVVPSLFLSGVNVIVFGVVPGFFISLAGETLGAGISFWIYRKGYSKWSHIRGQQWKWILRINRSGRIRQNYGLLLARLTPLIPSGIITLAAACSTMTFIDFLLITLLGKIPSIALETLIGHDLYYLKQNWPRLVISLVFVFLIYLLLKGKREIHNNHDQ